MSEQRIEKLEERVKLLEAETVFVNLWLQFFLALIKSLVIVLNGNESLVDKMLETAKAQAVRYLEESQEDEAR